LYKGRHRTVRHTVRRAAAALSGTLALTAGGVLAPLASASADGGVTVPYIVNTGSLPPVGDTTLPTGGGGCFETADTGWVCPLDPSTYGDDLPTGGPGELPGATDPDAFIVDPFAVAAKEAIVAQDQPGLAEELASGVTDAPPAEGDVPSNPTPYQPESGSPPTSYQTAISGYAQGNKPWCVGASTATMLSAMAVTSDVANIEAAEGWPGGNVGTPMGNAKPYLNKHQSQNYYQFDQAGSAAQLYSHVASDIYHRSAPVMIAVGTKSLSWWSQVPDKYQGLHALTIYLYYTKSSGGFNVWDSAGGNYNPGKFRINLASTWAAMGTSGAQDAEIW